MSSMNSPWWELGTQQKMLPLIPELPKQLHLPLTHGPGSEEHVLVTD